MFAKTVARSHVFYAPPFTAALQSSTLRFWRLAVYRNRYRDRVRRLSQRNVIIVRLGPTISSLLSPVFISVHTMPDNNSTPVAPTYNQLIGAVRTLTERLQLLESASSSQPPIQNTTLSATSSLDYRILSDVGTSVWSFTGHESSTQAEDWISSVDGTAQVNQWPLRHRLQYVRSNISQAARSWFLLEEFRDWDTFVQRFRTTFVRTLRKADLWRELEARIQEPNELTIDYFYAKLGMCHSLDLTFAETREYVIEGLRSQPLTDWVYGRTHSNRDNLLSDIRDWERMRAKRKEKFEAAGPTSAKPRKQRFTTEQPSAKSISVAPAVLPKTTSVSDRKPTRRGTVRRFIVTIAVARDTSVGIARNHDGR